jgi:7-cyano-7-deazaguanine synthase
MKKAVILFSGGLDSTTCLAIALSEGFECFAISFDYQQKHNAELQSAIKIAKRYAVHHNIISLPIGQFGGSSLTDQSLCVQNHMDSTDIPNTYVPARNTILLSIALGYAESIDADVIYTGTSSVDYSHYPDCRPEYIEAFQILANHATKRGIEGNPIRIEAPLLYLTKAETIKLGLSLGVDYSLSTSCYRADDHGLACGTCDSCFLRKKGFSEAGVIDPTRYVSQSIK